MYKKMVDELRRSVRGSLGRRKDRIEDGILQMETAISRGRSDKLYEHLAVTTRHIEMMVKELREAMITFHGDLQMTEMIPQTQPYPLAREVEVSLEDGCLSVKMPAMLPYPTDGAVYYIHELVDKALGRFMLENNLPRPYYTERAAVVFLHHYAAGKADQRHLRDYDNVEHRCITNMLAAHMLWGDSPKCIISMDVLAPGETNFTEIRIMPVTAFREFVMSEKLTFNIDEKS